MVRSGGVHGLGACACRRRRAGRRGDRAHVHPADGHHVPAAVTAGGFGVSGARGVRDGPRNADDRSGRPRVPADHRRVRVQSAGAGGHQDAARFPAACADRHADPVLLLLGASVGVSGARLRLLPRPCRAGGVPHVRAVGCGDPAGRPAAAAYEVPWSEARTVRDEPAAVPMPAAGHADPFGAGAAVGLRARCQFGYRDDDRGAVGVAGHPGDARSRVVRPGRGCTRFAVRRGGRRGRTGVHTGGVRRLACLGRADHRIRGQGGCGRLDVAVVQRRRRG